MVRKAKYRQRKTPDHEKSIAAESEKISARKDGACKRDKHYQAGSLNHLWTKLTEKPSNGRDAVGKVARQAGFWENCDV